MLTEAAVGAAVMETDDNEGAICCCFSSGMRRAGCNEEEGGKSCLQEGAMGNDGPNEREESSVMMCGGISDMKKAQFRHPPAAATAWCFLHLLCVPDFGVAAAGLWLAHSSRCPLVGSLVVKQ